MWDLCRKIDMQTQTVVCSVVEVITPPLIYFRAVLALQAAE